MTTLKAVCRIGPAFPHSSPKLSPKKVITSPFLYHFFHKYWCHLMQKGTIKIHSLTIHFISTQDKGKMEKLPMTVGVNKTTYAENSVYLHSHKPKSQILSYLLTYLTSIHWPIPYVKHTQNNTNYNSLFLVLNKKCCSTS